MAPLTFKLDEGQYRGADSFVVQGDPILPLVESSAPYIDAETFLFSVDRLPIEMLIYIFSSSEWRTCVLKGSVVGA